MIDLKNSRMHSFFLTNISTHADTAIGTKGIRILVQRRCKSCVYPQRSWLLAGMTSQIPTVVHVPSEVRGLVRIVRTDICSDLGVTGQQPRHVDLTDDLLDRNGV
jgi:hypothetical protein